MAGMSVYKYVSELFKGKVDKGGASYFEHCLRVAENSTDYRLGLLHDVMEDCGVSKDDLLNIGISERTVNAVEALTKKPGEKYLEEYIPRVVAYANDTYDLSVLSVKAADLIDNMDITRLPPMLTDDDLFRLKKYRLAYEQITVALVILSKTFNVRHPDISQSHKTLTR